MRFITAWADVNAENVVLKSVVGLLSICCLVFAVTAAKLALKTPLIVERACYSKVLTAASSERTTAEIEAFVREAIMQRFDSNAVVIAGFLSAEEEGFRKQEQETLKSRSIVQCIIFNSAKIEGNQVEVNADRLLSVGEVRSAFSFPLTLVLSTEDRTEANPYGLRLLRTSTIESKKGEKR